MGIPVARLSSLTAAITLGEPKSAYRLTREESEAWDQISAEVAEIKRRGQVVDMPSDWGTDLEIPNPTPPDA